MPTITITAETAARLQLLASAWDTSTEGAISRLIDRLSTGAAEAKVSQESSHHEIPVHALYEGHRVTGIYDTLTRSLTVTSAPLAGQSFKSPSGAAIAIVQTLKPEVHPNRNGWTFWTVTNTGSTLQSVRRV